ncbi:hypothetical protein MTO96_025900 [Rhipicephalus appendiculatus]
MDMPSLRHIALYLSNKGVSPEVPGEVRLRLTHHGHSERRRRMYEVDGGLQNLMNCESHGSSEVKTTVVNRTIPLPRLVTRRELTGSSVDLSRYLITLTDNALPYNYVVNVLANGV